MKNRIFTVAILLVLIMVSLSGTGQNQEKEFDRIVNEQNFENSPGFAVLIAKDTSVIYKKAFGYANLEHDVKLTPEHIFRIGSITKQFTACAILKLAEKGKLSLEDDITKYIKDYPVHGHSITIEHLLTHTSGIKSYTGMNTWTNEVRRKDFTPEELIEFFKKEPMDFAPGEEYRYNNSAYFMLGYIIENVSGKTYEEYLNEQFFVPLGMKNTSYDQTTKIIKNRASGYQKNNDRFENAEYLSMTQPYAAGSLLSTVGDLFRWYTAVMNDKVISRENREKAHTSYALNNGEPTGYGFGWALGNIHGSPMIEHGGGINGFLTSSMYLPEEKVFVAVFSNCDAVPPQNTAIKLAALAINKPYNFEEIKPGQKTVEYTGVYESGKKETRTVVAENDSLWIVHPSGSRERLAPFAKDKFFIKNTFTEITFDRGEQEKIVALRINGTGYLPDKYLRTEKPVELRNEIQLPDELLIKYIGKYQLQPGFVVTISKKDGKIFAQVTGQSEFEIVAFAEHKFFSKEFPLEIVFHLNEKNEVIKLTAGQEQQEAKKIE